MYTVCVITIAQTHTQALTQAHKHVLYVPGKFLHEELSEEFEVKAGSVKSKGMGVIALALG